jgi:hypothetical protein
MTAAALIYEVESEMLANLVRLLTRGSIGSAEWQVRALQSLGLLEQINAATIKAHRDEIAKAAQDEIRRLAASRLSMVDAASDMAGVVTRFPDLRTAAILTRWDAEVSRKLDTIYATMLRSAGDRYVETVKVATAKTAIGMSGRKAVAEIVQGWADLGLPGFKDAAGREWTPEAYASTLVRSSSTQAATATQFARMEELGEDLVEVSSHLGARPKCAPYQGRIFSLSGKSSIYPWLYSPDNTEWGNTVGTPGGLLGVNCRHILYPYFPGTKATYSPYPEEKNDAAYKRSQEQRAIERSIRGAKRELDLAQKVGDEAAIQAAKSKVSERQKVMRGFIDDTGRRRDYDREQIRG